MGQLFEELKSLAKDKRLLEWYLAQGLISREEVKAYYESLPDLSSRCEPFSLEDMDWSSN